MREIDLTKKKILVNIGSGSEISIKDLVKLITEITGFGGDVGHPKTKRSTQKVS